MLSGSCRTVALDRGHVALFGLTVPVLRNPVPGLPEAISFIGKVIGLIDQAAHLRRVGRFGRFLRRSMSSV
jgi:hypothetical protein